ncbi:hypothetical protein [Microbacterium sp. C7(2022)]|uniref:hypothetical protein n=1 Tax=Microbacterium sp. C7(2022) TaxID=2992759 RepID=UPI00237A52D6|nr:hypothetical protein [Microbacterium sp. C7(2022)]MDE0545663.1 hypothetical protein [Microbacterium sp. C7(2022)]
MVAHVLRLRLALLVGAFRGDIVDVSRTVVQYLVVAGATAAGCWALLSLRDSPVEVALTVTVLAGSAATVGFALSPLIGAASDPLDPRRFAVVGPAPGPLAGALAMAGMISVPVIALAALAISTGVMWSSFGAPVATTVIGGALGVITCSLAARVCLAAASLFLKERQSRELTGLFLLLIIIVVVPAGVFLSSLEWEGIVPSQLSEAVQLLAITPLGAAWAYPGLIVVGNPASTTAILVALATIVVLVALWVLLVRRTLTTTERPLAVRERRGLGWFAVAPGTPGGAIAARSLLYWLNDQRYLMNLLVIPVAAAATTVPLLVAGVAPETVALVPVPFAALFLGWLVHNDVAYDSTAVWMHFASGVRGLADRVGRLVPVFLIGTPALAVAIPIAVSLHGRWSILPAMIGLCACLFLTGLGLSSIASAAAPYPVSRPGDSPFRQPARTGSTPFLSQGMVLLGVLLLSAPVFWWSWLAIEDPTSADRALWGGVGIGCGTLVFGVAIGAAVFERRSGRLMEFAEAT